MSGFAVDYVDEHIEVRMYEEFPKLLGKILAIGIANVRDRALDIETDDVAKLSDELLEK